MLTPLLMDPAYFELTFLKYGCEHTRRIRVYIELNSGDEDLLISDSTEEKSRAIVRRTGILVFLPSGLNPDWPRFGRILDCSVESLELGLKPTVIHGHNVWIIDRIQSGQEDFLERQGK
jgi:hypothetical protein